MGSAAADLLNGKGKRLFSLDHLYASGALMCTCSRRPGTGGGWGEWLCPACDTSHASWHGRH